MSLLHDDLATGDALRGIEVEVLLVLHRPPGIDKLAVDEHACTLLRRQPLITRTLGHRAQDTYMELGNSRFACLAQETGALIVAELPDPPERRISSRRPRRGGVPETSLVKCK